ISGQSDIADADFSDYEAKQIGTELEKAIRRSATARAAAARRRVTASPIVEDVEEKTVAGQTVGMEEFSAITSEPSDVREEVEVENENVEITAPGNQGAKKRRRRRRRRRH
ncbi:MAG: hypothetical protein K2K55_10150, partial [Duncaniella sp.]|nr:hypothetical protein [Duncaniella sp.]